MSRFSKRFLLCAAVILGFVAFALGTAGAQQSQQMVASWYGPGFEGASTASGAPFDPYGYTAAHKTLPFGTKLIVTYNGASVVVEVNDRGPYVAGRDLDLSQGAADYIGITAVGEGVVDVTYADASTPTGPYSGSTAPASTQQQTPAPQNNSTAPSQAATDDASSAQTQYDNGGNAAQAQYEDDNTVEDQPTNEAAAEEQYGAADDQYDEEPDSSPLDDLPLSETPDVETPEVPTAAEVAPTVEEVAPMVEEVAPKAEPIDTVYEAPKVVTGITVLPDTGGLPLLPLAGVAASLLLGGGIAVRMLRK